MTILKLIFKTIFFDDVTHFRFRRKSDVTISYTGSDNDSRIPFAWEAATAATAAILHEV